MDAASFQLHFLGSIALVGLQSTPLHCLDYGECALVDSFGVIGILGREVIRTVAAAVSESRHSWVRRD